jgi:prophage maintenance system killer protein
MLMFLEINQVSWTPPSDTERALAVEALAARTMSEGEFIDWLRRYAVPEP